VFRFLATMLVLGVIHSLAWLTQAMGRIAKSLKSALMVTPTMILGGSIGTGAASGSSQRLTW
jgi:hypothetical protein